MVGPRDFDVDVALGLRVLHAIVGFEQHRQLVGGEGAVGLVDCGVEKRGLARILLDGGAGADNVSGVIAFGGEVNVGLELQLVGVGIVVGSRSGAGSL